MKISAEALQGQLDKLQKASWREPRFLQKKDSKESVRKVIASIDLRPKSYTDFTAEELEKYEKSDLEKLLKNLIKEKTRLSSVNSTIANGRNFFERVYKIAAGSDYIKDAIIKKINEIKRVDKNLNITSYCDTIVKAIGAKKLPEDIKSYFEEAIDKSNKGIDKGRKEIALINEKLKLIEQCFKYLAELDEQAKQAVIPASNVKLSGFAAEKTMHINEIKKAVVFMASIAASFMVLGTASAATLSLTCLATAYAKHVINKNSHDHINQIADLANKYLLFGVTGFSVGMAKNLINYAGQVVAYDNNAQVNTIMPYITNSVLASGCCVALGAPHGLVTFSFIKGVEIMQSQVNYWTDFKRVEVMAER